MNQKKKKRKKIRAKKEHNEILIKDKIIGNIRTLFEQEEDEDYCRPKRVSKF